MWQFAIWPFDASSRRQLAAISGALTRDREATAARAADGCANVACTTLCHVLQQRPLHHGSGMPPGRAAHDRRPKTPNAFQNRPWRSANADCTRRERNLFQENALFLPPGRAPGCPEGAPGCPGRAPGGPEGTPGCPEGARGCPHGAPGCPGAAPDGPEGAPGGPRDATRRLRLSMTSFRVPAHWQSRHCPLHPYKATAHESLNGRPRLRSTSHP